MLFFFNGCFDHTIIFPFLYCIFLSSQISFKVGDLHNTVPFSLYTNKIPLKGSSLNKFLLLQVARKMTKATLHSEC